MVPWLFCFFISVFYGLGCIFLINVFCCFDRVFMLMFFILLVALVVLFYWSSSWPSLRFSTNVFCGLAHAFILMFF
jgi:hypothetical protein